MIYLVDTNIFLRTLIKEDDQVFEECRQFLEVVKFNRIKAVTVGLVLAEVVWTLTSYYEFSRESVVGAVKAIISLRGLKIVDTYDYRLALDWYGEKNVKFIDACVAAVSQVVSKKWVVVSYDKDFDRLGVIRQEPAMVLRGLGE